MLSEWTLGNFKSIARKVSLRMAPLTIVCGANSSGKSTIIQSMLLVSQTLGSPASHRALIFNGELVRLGYLNDVLHNGRDDEPMEVGFRIVRSSRLGLRQIGTTRVQLQSQGRSIGVRARFTKPADAAINSSKVDLESTLLDVDGRPIRLTRVTPPNRVREWIRRRNWQVPEDIRDDIRNGNYAHELSMDDPEFEPVRSRSASGESFASLTHFLPGLRLVTRDAREEYLPPALLQVARLLDSDLVYPATARRIDPIAEPEITQLIKSELERMRKEKLHGKSDRAIQDLALASSTLSRSASLSAWLESVHRHLQRQYRRELADTLRVIAGRESPSPSVGEEGDLVLKAIAFPPDVADAINEISDLFVHRLRYLGPLRDDPKMIYSLSPIPDSKDVGIKGEYTAAVLERFGASVYVRCPLPPTDKQSDFKFERVSLIRAVILWLQHLGMVEDVTPSERGKMGVELSIQAEGLARPLDLTNVGVGVSQLLPILTLCLLAPEDGMVLLEQPELHLHPKVQAGLADFLLGISARGTQCIIETHSERLINRIRRRIAEAPDDLIMRLVQIYFTEREKAATRIIPVEPNEYGAIPNWPKGFFDEGPNEATLIAKAATEKRQANLKRAG